jgi:hypothetical protein
VTLPFATNVPTLMPSGPRRIRAFVSVLKATSETVSIVLSVASAVIRAIQPTVWPVRLSLSHRLPMRTTASATKATMSITSDAIRVTQAVCPALPPAVWLAGIATLMFHRIFQTTVSVKKGILEMGIDAITRTVIPVVRLAIRIIA